MRSVAIGEVAILNPTRPAHLVDSGELIPFIPMAAVRQDGGAPDEERRSLADTNRGYTYFEKGDVLLAKITPCFENGKVAHLDSLSHDFGFGSTEFHVLRAGPDVNSRYLYHAVRSPRFRRDGASSMTGSAGQRRVPAAFVSKYRIPLPLLPEQRRIAAMMDRAEAIRRKRVECVSLLDEFVRSAFLEMFGDAVLHPGTRHLTSKWRLATVESIAAPVSNACAGGPFGSSLTRADYVPTAGVPVIRGNNVLTSRGSFRDDGFVFVTDAKAEELKRNIALPGDIIFTQRGTLGQIARIPHSSRYDRYVISQSQMKVTLNESVVDPTYFVNYFLSPRALLEIELRAMATGVPHINLSILKTLTVVLPPLESQRRFAGLASLYTSLREKAELAAREADDLVASLGHQVLRHSSVSTRAS